MPSVQPNKKYLNLDPRFWAYVKAVSQHAGYTVRNKGEVKVPGWKEIIETLESLGVDKAAVHDDSGPTAFGNLLLSYFEYRATALNEVAKNNLMGLKDAKKIFKSLLNEYKPHCPIPQNKQKGEKKGPAYFTGIINIIIEAAIADRGCECDFNPRSLTTFTSGNGLVRTLSRWVDGAFPGAVNPIAVWEIKEYYYTTTFGSRVADGIYESMLDGMELQELRDKEKIDTHHYLFIDDYFTWWDCGRSYLCRIVDIMHMGLIDEVLFGKEVTTRLPILVKEWVKELKRRR